jgi:hypothetical protein
MKGTIAGLCRFCHCTEQKPCTLPSGDECWWFDKDRTVCTNPQCINAFTCLLAQLRAKAERKRTPGDIHRLMQEERRERRRASKARKK